MSEDATLDEFVEGSSSPSESERVETSIGKLPSHWRVEWLDEVCSINPDGFSEDDWPSGTFEYISLSNVSEGKILQSETTPLDEAPSRAQRQIKEGDVLVGTVRPKQVSHGFVTAEHDGKICSSGFGVLRTSQAVHPHYLIQEILSHRFFRQMEAYVAGSGYPAVKIGDLKRHRISVPPIEEQRKIATVLHNIDQAIGKTEEIIKQTIRTQKGVEQRLFREGYFNHSDIQEKRLVTIPKDWDFDQLSEHTIDSAFGPRFGSERYDDEGDILTLRTTDLNDRGHISLETMPGADLEREEIREHLLEPGDFMITRSGTTGIGTVWESYDKPTIPGAFLIRFRFEDTLNPNFMKYYVNSSIGRSRVNRRAKGGVQKNLAGSDLLNMRFPIPNKEEQKKIVEVLDTIEERIKHERDYKTKLQHFKKGLMQDLLSGKVRTTDTNIEVPEEIKQHG